MDGRSGSFRTGADVSGQRRRPACLPHFADEAESLARQRADEALVLAAVADGGPGRVDAGREHQFRDDPATPDSREQIILGRDTLAVADQIFEEIEHLRFKRNQAGPTAQLAPIRVEDKILE